MEEQIHSERHAERHRLAGLAAVAGYALVSFVYFGVRPLVEGGHQFIGYAYDPQIFIWAFAWWPHAVLHGENPFVTHAIWDPYGVNLTWSTSVPGLALLFAPLTLTVGPILSYDVAAVLLPALAAWTAYLLCRHLTRSLWPSLVGGYLYGFSSYVVAQDGYGGHVNLGSVFLLPAIALVMLRFLDGGLAGRGFILRLAPLLALQVLFSTEIALGVALAIVIGLPLLYALVPSRRGGILRMLAPLTGAGALAAVLTAPFLYYLLSGGVRPPYYAQTDEFDADIANVFVPTKLTIAGGTFLGGVSRRFLDNLPEQGAYIGLPTLLILVLYSRERWRTPTVRFLLAALAAIVLLSFGARATFAGHQLVPLPWKLIASQPVFDNVLTNRFIVLATLVTAVVVALWTAARRPGILRTVLPALGVIAVMPNLWHSGLATTYDIPPFFTESVYRTCIDPGETVLPFPLRGSGNALLWQVDEGFRFNMAAGDIGPDIPVQFFEPSSIAPVAGGLPLGVTDGAILKTFLRGKGVTSIVVDANDANSYAGAVDQVAKPQVVGGVYLYHLTPDAPSCPS